MGYHTALMSAQKTIYDGKRKLVRNRFEEEAEAKAASQAAE